MLIRKLPIKINNWYRFQFISSSNIHDYNFNSLKIKTNNSILIKYDRSSDYACYRSILTNNNVQIFHFQTFSPTRSTLRFKNTDSTTVSKEENKNAEEIIKKINVTPLTRSEKLKKAVKEYGSTVIVFHVAISLVSLGTCYLLVTSGLDVTKLIAAVGLEDWMAKSEFAASAGTFAVAYAVHKVFAPVRITITLASVPLIVRYLRRIGFLKK